MIIKTPITYENEHNIFVSSNYANEHVLVDIIIEVQRK